MVIEGARKRTFHKTIEGAKQTIPSSIVYRDPKGSLQVENMKTTEVVETSDYFSIISRNPIFPDGIQEFRVEIEKVDFDPKEDQMYFVALIYNTGYYHDVICGKERLADIQEYANTEADAIKLAEKYNGIKKAWEEECGPLGYTGEFLSIKRIYIQN